MNRLRCSAWCAVALVSLGGHAWAAVLAGWNVDGVDVNDGIGIETNAAPYAFYATTSGVEHVEAVMTLGDGANPSTSTGQYGFKIPSGEQTNTLAGAIELNHYMEFSITADPGYVLNLESVEMVGEGTSGACSNVVLMTSIDGFVTGQEIASAYPANRTGGFDTDSSGFGGPIDLSSAEYQNLAGTVSFRIYGWNSTSGSSTTRIRNLTGDDLVVYGEVIQVSAESSPLLSVTHSNGMASVVVEFTEAPATNYVLQYSGSLTNSNGWASVSAPFSSNTNWTFSATNQSGFYRAVSE